MKRDAVRYFTGTGVNSGDVLFTTESLENCASLSTFTTSAGAATLEATLDGTNWIALAFKDLTSTTPTTYVATTAAGKMYYVEGRFRLLRLKQSGATAATAIMMVGGHPA